MGKRGFKSALEKTIRKTPDSGAYPDPLPHMSEHAKTIWQEVVRSMPPSFWQISDGPMLEQYCEAIATFREATEIIRREGAIITEQRPGYHGAILTRRKVHPAVALQNAAAARCRLFAMRLGLGPASRNNRQKVFGLAREGTRLAKIAPQAGDDDDDDLLYHPPAANMN